MGLSPAPCLVHSSAARPQQLLWVSGQGPHRRDTELREGRAVGLSTWPHMGLAGFQVILALS